MTIQPEILAQMMLSTGETRFDFDAPRVNGDGTAVISLRAYIDGVQWGAKEIHMTKEQVDSVVDRPVIAGLTRREDVYVAFGEWLITEGIIAGKFGSPVPSEPPVVEAPKPPAEAPAEPVDAPKPEQLPVVDAPESPYEVPVVQGEPEVLPELNPEVEAKE